ncbi:MAG: hypothetical protein H0U65_06885 [Rubrobacter sp.]|jgi:hypothetical protein|nr:hypothetical protein [Rubrobacter sp.]
METLLNVIVAILRLVPLVLVFYIPSLIGMAIWSEKGEAYKVKAGIWLAVGFTGVLIVEIVFRHVSFVQVASTIGVSAFQFAVALALAALTVYKLAD